MQITTTYLRQVIKEEINQVLYEQEAEETVQGFLDILNKEIEKRPEVEKEIKENKKLSEGPNPWKDPKTGKLIDISGMYDGGGYPDMGDRIRSSMSRGDATAKRTGQHKKKMRAIGGVVGTFAGMGAQTLGFMGAAIAALSNPQLAEFIRTLQDQAVITLGPGGFALAMSAPIAIGAIAGALKGYFKGKKEEESFNKILDDALQNKP